MSAYIRLRAPGGDQLPVYRVATNSSVLNYIITGLRGVYKYNFDRDEWEKILNEQNDFDFYGCSAVINNNKQKLYILTSDGDLGEVDLNDNTFKIVTNKKTKIGSAKSIIINDTVHVIGGSDNNFHLKWNEKNKKFIRVNQTYDNRKYHYFGLVHVQKTNSLLSFGGLNDDAYSGMSDIVEYDINAQKWNKLEVSLPDRLYLFGCTLAFKATFVIIFGGWNASSGQYCDNIYIYDVKNKIIKESHYKCPTKWSYSAISVHHDLNDELTVFGYVRNQMEISNVSLQDFPPIDLLNIIKSYYYNEYIYLLSGENHHKINVLDIISDQFD